MASSKNEVNNVRKIKKLSIAKASDKDFKRTKATKKATITDNSHGTLLDEMIKSLDIFRADHWFDEFMKDTSNMKCMTGEDYRISNVLSKGMDQYQVFPGDDLTSLYNDCYNDICDEPESSEYSFMEDNDLKSVSMLGNYNFDERSEYSPKLFDQQKDELIKIKDLSLSDILSV